MTDQVPTPYDEDIHRLREQSTKDKGWVLAMDFAEALRIGWLRRDEQARREREAVDALLVALEDEKQAARNGTLDMVSDAIRRIDTAIAAVRAAREA